MAAKKTVPSIIPSLPRVSSGGYVVGMSTAYPSTRTFEDPAPKKEYDLSGLTKDERAALREKLDAIEESAALNAEAQVEVRRDASGRIIEIEDMRPDLAWRSSERRLKKLVAGVIALSFALGLVVGVLV